MRSKQFHLMGTDLFGDEVKPDAGGSVLRERFEFPPFSVLNAREGAWQARKTAWISSGIKSELGRVGTGNETETGNLSRKVGIGITTDAYRKKGAAVHGAGASGTSIFDPVLCELMYRWFVPKNGLVLDPFAGGSVRGIVAGLLGFRYYGIDLHQAQVDANETQRAEIAQFADVTWKHGDSGTLIADAPRADFVFSCPPYGNLERYSDNPADLSTMEWEVFSDTYSQIIAKAVERLKPDRFACFVVGEFRDKKSGTYRGFVPLTIKAFEDAGARFYNEAILITVVGSLSVRVSQGFELSRKLGKTHQNILVFCKGDPKAAAAAVNGVTTGGTK